MTCFEDVCLLCDIHLMFIAMVVVIMIVITVFPLSLCFFLRQVFSDSHANFLCAVACFNHVSSSVLHLYSLSGDGTAQ